MILYRYENHLESSIDSFGFLTKPRVRIQCVEYEVIKKTPKGYWVSLGFGDKKFMLREAKKKFAHETKEDALYSFIRRKEVQINILERQLESAKQALQQATETKRQQT